MMFGFLVSVIGIIYMSLNWFFHKNWSTHARAGIYITIIGFFIVIIATKVSYN